MSSPSSIRSDLTARRAGEEFGRATVATVVEGTVSYRLGRRPVLDGLRGIAVLLVIVAHAQVPYAASAGMVGVTLFFVLSGFLITRLLVEETERTGRVDLRAFYGRRARRLFPALIALLAVTLIISGGTRAALWRALVALTYTSNIVGVSHDMGPLGHTWSLAMEEQFYLLWPLILVWVGRRRPTWLVPGILVAITIVSTNRVLLSLSGATTWRVLIAPDTRVDGLLVGCLVALLITRLARRQLSRYAAAGGVVLLAVAPNAERLEGVLLIPAMIAGASVVAWGATSRGGWLTADPLVALGRISYGVYLWHYPVTKMLEEAGVGWAVNLLVTAVSSVALAAVSWRYVEAPIMARGRRTVAPPVPAAVARA